MAFTVRLAGLVRPVDTVRPVPVTKALLRYGTSGFNLTTEGGNVYPLFAEPHPTQVLEFLREFADEYKNHGGPAAQIVSLVGQPEGSAYVLTSLKRSANLVRVGEIGPSEGGKFSGTLNGRTIELSPMTPQVKGELAQAATLRGSVALGAVAGELGGQFFQVWGVELNSANPRSQGR